MTFLLILFAIFMITFGGTLLVLNARSYWSWVLTRKENKTPVLTKKDTNGLSEPAKRIVEKYNSLPADMRGEDVLSMVKALDVKHGVKDANDHFRVNDYGSQDLDYATYGSQFPTLFSEYAFSWNGGRACKHQNDCKFTEYRSMMTVMHQVETAKREQDRAFEIAEVQPDLDAIESWKERLRVEERIMNEITKEIL